MLGILVDISGVVDRGGDSCARRGRKTECERDMATPAAFPRYKYLISRYV